MSAKTSKDVIQGWLIIAGVVAAILFTTYRTFNRTCDDAKNTYNNVVHAIENGEGRNQRAHDAYLAAEQEMEKLCKQ